MVHFLHAREILAFLLKDHNKTQNTVPVKGTKVWVKCDILSQLKLQGMSDFSFLLIMKDLKCFQEPFRNTMADSHFWSFGR